MKWFATKRRWNCISAQNIIIQICNILKLHLQQQFGNNHNGEKDQNKGNGKCKFSSDRFMPWNGTTNARDDARWSAASLVKTLIFKSLTKYRKLPLARQQLSTSPIMSCLFCVLSLKFAFLTSLKCTFFTPSWDC